MASTITFSGNKIEQDGDETTVYNVEPSDFVNDFICTEILDEMEFSDVLKYVTDRSDDE